MTTYILQGRYSIDGIKGMIANPEDRAPAVRALMEGAGMKLVQYYVTFGEYDFLIVLEAPAGHEVDVMAAMMAAAGSGGVSHLKTTVAVTTADAKTAMAGAKKLAKSFRGAGQKK